MPFVINGDRFDDQLIEDELAYLQKTYSEKLSTEEYGKIESKLLPLARENVVVRILFEQKAFEADPVVEFQEIQEEFRKMIDAFGGLAAFHERFEKSEADHQEILENVEKSLKVDRFIETICGEIPVEDTEIAEETHRLKEEGLSFQDAEPAAIRASVKKMVIAKKKNHILKNYKAQLRKQAVVSFL